VQGDGACAKTRHSPKTTTWRACRAGQKSVGDLRNQQKSGKDRSARQASSRGIPTGGFLRPLGARILIVRSPDLRRSSEDPLVGADCRLGPDPRGGSLPSAAKGHPWKARSFHVRRRKIVIDDCFKRFWRAPWPWRREALHLADFGGTRTLKLEKSWFDSGSKCPGEPPRESGPALSIRFGQPGLRSDRSARNKTEFQARSSRCPSRSPPFLL